MQETLAPYVASRTYATLDDAKGDEALVREILGAGNGARHRCPFHEGAGKSLTIAHKDGIWLWHCWSACACGGTVVDALARRNGISEAEAIRLLVGSVGGQMPRQKRGCRKKRELGAPVSQGEPIPPEPRALRLDTVEKVIDEYLCQFPVQLAARGIPDWVLQQYRFAFLDAFVFKGNNRNYEVSNSWLIPISGQDGRVRAIKLHREVPDENGRKCGWVPVGRHRPKSPHGWATLWPPPEDFDEDGLPELLDDWPEEWRLRLEEVRGSAFGFEEPIVSSDEIDAMAEAAVRREQKRKNPILSTRWLYLLPGELKALAVIGARMEATAITGGESHKWTPGMVARLKGRKVCVIYDDDEAGISFRDRTVVALEGAAAELKAITFGSKGKRKVDANDVAAADGPNVLRRQIKDLQHAAPDLAKRPFDLNKHRDELHTVLKEALEPDSPVVSCIGSVIGSGKSTTASEIMAASDNKYLLLVKDHRLAKEYEERLKGADAMRLLSPDRMTKEDLLTCPSLKEIADLGKRGIPYTQKVCGACAKRNDCPVFRQKNRIESTRILIGQHAHLRLLDYKPAYTEDRVVVVDESAVLGGLRWRVEFDKEDLNGFLGMLKTFEVSQTGHNRALQEIRLAIAKIEGLSPGDSVTLNGPEVALDRSLMSAWGKWLADADVRGRNLMGPLVYTLVRNRWVRCSEMTARKKAPKNIGLMHETERKRVFCLVQEPEVLKDTPVVLLDATHRREPLEAVFPGRDLRFYPDGPVPPPRSEVVQLLGARNPALTLWDEEKKRPRKAFERICRHVEAAVEHYGIDWERVGMITLKRLEPFVAELLPKLPMANVHHYPCRGINGLKDVRLLAIVGVQQPPDAEMAKDAVTLFDLDRDPGDLLDSRRLAWKGMQALHGTGYEIESLDYGDPHMNLVYDLLVTAELVQAIGRARVYEPRDWPQRVIVFTEQPLPMPVTRILHWKEHLKEIGGEMDTQPTIEERVLEGMQALMTEPFGYSELAKVVGVSENTLKKKAEYREAIEGAAGALDLKLVRGRREPGRFEGAA